MLVSKENLGCAILLLLVILLSLAKVFNIFIDTPLARIVLILFVLVLSYLNKVLGVVSVLFILIILSSVTGFYQEGFDTNTMINESQNKDDKTKEKPKEEVQKGDNKVTVTTDSNKDNKIPTPPVAMTADTSSTANSSDINVSSVTTTSTEGFDTIGIENDIKKGKQSNSIPVSSFMKESQFVSAYEANPFKENFSNF